MAKRSALALRLLAVAALAPACAANAGWEQRTPSAPPPLPSTELHSTVVPSPAVSTDPWASMERSRLVDEMEGEPVRLQPGARCTVYRKLPSASYGVSTLVRDACLEIPSGTIIEVREGALLVVLATNGLRVGRGVRLNAKGASGRRGARAPFANVRREIATDAEIKALCVDDGNRCDCPTTSL
jgi:hypothetical protein